MATTEHIVTRRVVGERVLALRCTCGWQRQGDWTYAEAADIATRHRRNPSRSPFIRHIVTEHGDERTLCGRDTAALRLPPVMREADATFACKACVRVRTSRWARETSPASLG